ncbi:MAG TPA: MBL fold metallo-hydrolase [Caulobacteraceae bacterium]|jgi:glyoxylase-like metal-dependent hydrolase (beta-lactamase superfamily II)|nr:MBL fold metallo-hydrolase [Caulobacteraceae bacterium]
MNRITLCALVSATALLAEATAALAAAAPAPAAPNFAAVQIKATDLGHRTWMLEGQGGNMTVIAGDDGVILVDTEFAPLHDKIKAAIAEVSKQPVRYVVNTHFHGDHTGGNQGFWLDGATVVATSNLRKTLAEGSTNMLTGAKTPPAPQGALPGRTYTGATTVAVKGRRVQLVAMPHAHTGGDTAVFVTDANVIATGDIVSTGMRYPNIDVADAGDIDGIIAAVDTYLKRSNAQTKIVPGHGALMTRPELAAYRKLLADAREAVRRAKAAGMTEDQVVEAKLLADVQTRAGANDMASANFARLIYRSVG